MYKEIAKFKRLSKKVHHAIEGYLDDNYPIPIGSMNQISDLYTLFYSFCDPLVEKRIRFGAYTNNSNSKDFYFYNNIPTHYHFRVSVKYSDEGIKCNPYHILLHFNSKILNNEKITLDDLINYFETLPSYNTIHNCNEQKNTKN